MRKSVLNESTPAAAAQAWLESVLPWDDLEAFLEAADRLAAQPGSEGELIPLALLLRSGLSPAEADWRAEIRRRSGMPAVMEPAPPPLPRPTALDVAVAELRSILLLAGEGASPPAGQDAGAGEAALEVAALRLLHALHAAASPGAFADIAAAAGQLRESLGRPPPDAEEAGRRFGREALRGYLLDIHDLVFPPLGAPAALHAFVRTSVVSAGACGRPTDDLARTGREALALLELALGRPLGEASEALQGLGVLLIAARVRTETRPDLVDAVADLGLPAPLRAWGAAVGRVSGQGVDRELVQRLRDAGLDLGELELAYEMQSLLAERWSDDKNEWQALADIAGYRGEFEEARQLFGRALALDGGLEHARECLEALEAGERDRFANRGGFGSSPERRRLRAARLARPDPHALATEAAALRLAQAGGGPIAELTPSPPPRRGWIPDDGLHLRRLGARRRRSPWGELPALRGVEAVRGFYVSRQPIHDVAVLIGGRVAARATPSPHPVADGDERLKHAFNVWLDLSAVPPGRHELELEVTRSGAEPHRHREWVLVEPPVAEADAPGSDMVVDPPPGRAEPLDDWVNGRPTGVRAARRALFEGAPERVLVIRADQLGDLVCSIPALRRLRQLLPEAALTGLVTPGNAALARSLHLFDEVMVIDFPVDPVERRRLMAPERQQELQRELHARRFDLALDLAEASTSRHLLELSGARTLFGMQGDGYGFLQLEFKAHAFDRFNASEAGAASAKMLAMVEWLGAAMTPLGRTERREDLPASGLRAFALKPRGYALLHTGAQLRFSRWPHSAELARLLLEHTDLDVVLIREEATTALELGPGLVGRPRFRLIERPLAFDELDLLVSWCAVFVGNDSGPKHLASLRGSEVVSLHCPRNNWNEWGQENTGVVMSRRVPCAGCQVKDFPDECGRDFVCLTAIRPAEVLAAVLDRLDVSRPV